MDDILRYIPINNYEDIYRYVIDKILRLFMHELKKRHFW